MNESLVCVVGNVDQPVCHVQISMSATSLLAFTKGVMSMVACSLAVKVPPPSLSGRPWLTLF